MNRNHKLTSTVRTIVKDLLQEAQQERTLSDILDQDPSFFSTWSLDRPTIILNTYGDVQDLLRGVRKAQGVQVGRDILKAIFMTLLPPGWGTAASGIEMLTRMYREVKPKKTGTIIDQLTVDPYVAAIVDDDVERQFINEFYKHIMKQPADKPLPSFFNVTRALEMYLQNKFNGRTVTRVRTRT